MNIDAVYAKYKHLDALLSDSEWEGDDLRYRIAHDLWVAVKKWAAETESRTGVAEQEETIFELEQEVAELEQRLSMVLANIDARDLKW